jgi:bla regulator protein BlaR1
MIVELFRALAEATIAFTLAVAIVLSVRRPLLARLGASVVYAAWLLVPVALLAVLLPAPEGVAERMMTLIGETQPVPIAIDTTITPALTPLHMLLGGWALGACVMLVMLWRQQLAFRHAIRGAHHRADGLHESPTTAGLPAVIGLLRPRIVVPVDFDARYDEAERELILCHEHIHIRRLDLPANAAVALLRAVFWFNPLAHFAAARFRRDQELACDEQVIARHPHQRRAYANAMLKTHIAGTPLPAGCHWQDSTPLKERIAMLKLHAPGPGRTLLGAILLAALSLSGGYATWAAQPPREGEGQSAGSRFLVLVTMEIDGEVRRYEIQEDADTPFSLAMEKDGHRYQGQFTVRDAGVDKALFEAELLRNGERTSSPRVMVDMGKPARMESGSPEGPQQKLTVVVTRMPSDQQAPLSVVSESRPVPAYPVTAFERSLGGRVVVQVDVAEDGNVRSVTVVSSEPAGVFDSVAVESARHMKFNPQIENGRPIARTVRVPIRFEPNVGEQAAGSSPAR